MESAGVSPATQKLLAPERPRLGAMKPPAAAAPGEARAIALAVKASFDDAFRIVGWMCGGLAVLASLSAVWGVRNKTKSGSSGPQADSARGREKKWRPELGPPTIPSRKLKLHLGGSRRDRLGRRGVRLDADVGALAVRREQASYATSLPSSVIVLTAPILPLPVTLVKLVWMAEGS